MNTNKTLLALLIAASATPAVATTPDPAVLKGFNSTKNVSVVYNTGCTATATGGGTTYNCWGAASSHSAGDKQYATTSAFGGIGFVVVTPGASLTAPSAPSTPTDSTIPSGFSAM